MLLETSLQAQVLIPMAASLIFGLITGTLLILILVPVFYCIYGTMLRWLDLPLYRDEDHDDDDFDFSDSTVDRYKNQRRKELSERREPAMTRELGDVGPAH